MLIVIPELDEEQVRNTVARFQTVITRTGGEASEPRFWGKRRLAYEIDNRNDAFYVVMEFTAGERTLVELKRILRVSDDVMRNMIVKLPPEALNQENTTEVPAADETPSEPETVAVGAASEADADEPTDNRESR
ncbi:30S ribosomal protein S6 [Rubrobacter indicoceani]|uniref:30S ribosomal protein S6 n=1 Tax=Rubrobacter indicoceani TaxID=2051957 RepID=UPI001968C834|nr:30S ribosomal protein S6 [Rubrobacter indicoceani]